MWTQQTHLIRVQNSILIVEQEMTFPGYPDTIARWLLNHPTVIEIKAGLADGHFQCAYIKKVPLKQRITSQIRSGPDYVVAFGEGFSALIIQEVEEFLKLLIPVYGAWQLSKAMTQVGKILSDKAKAREAAQQFAASMCKELAEASKDPITFARLHGALTAQLTLALLGILAGGGSTAVRARSALAKAQKVLRKATANPKKYQRKASPNNRHTTNRFGNSQKKQDPRGVKEKSGPKKRKSGSTAPQPPPSTKAASPKPAKKNKLTPSKHPKKHNNKPKIVPKKLKNGASTVTIQGNVAPKGAPRLHVPKKIRDWLNRNFRDHDLAHLWGPGFGHDVREVLWAAPKKFNSFQNKTIENVIRKLARRDIHKVRIEVKAETFGNVKSGGHLVPRKTLRLVEYIIIVQDSKGKFISDPARVSLELIKPPKKVGNRWVPGSNKVEVEVHTHGSSVTKTIDLGKQP
ncbi:MAG: hypothetical protein GY805_30935 [Chloroflexi bacterium]|nr:hypothetical protein [Chloroflexota bacterium]